MGGDLPDVQKMPRSLPKFRMCLESAIWILNPFVVERESERESIS